MRASFGVATAGLLLSLLLASQSAPVVAEELIWEGLPLRIHLPTGRERTVRFPEQLRRVRLPGLSADRLRTQVVDRSVHWLAATDFTAERVVVEAVGDRAYLLDLSAGADGSASAVQIRRLRPGAEKPDIPAPVRLTRFAAQRLFAPRRLVPDNVAVRALAVKAYPQAYPLLQGVALDYELLGSWRGYGYYLTAVGLLNRSPLRVPLDPRLLDHRRIRGDWLTSSFQHRWLEAAGSSGATDSTVLYLVSRRPFHRSLLSAMR